jgi:hypothetical protein
LGDRDRRFFGFDLSPWAMLAIGACVTLAAIHFAVVRPTTRQITQLQAQVQSLETGIRGLTGQRGAVGAANTLLGQLAEQGHKSAQASRALTEISALHERLSEQTDRAERALVVMEKLSTLEDTAQERRLAPNKPMR